MQTIDGEEYLDVDEAIQLLRVKRATLYTYVSRHILQSYKQRVGRQRLYKRSEVEALLAVRPDHDSTPPPRPPLTETWVGDH